MMIGAMTRAACRAVPLTSLVPAGTFWALEGAKAMRLSGRTVLITGGSSGIGLELARLLVARANTVLITGRDLARLEAVKRELSGVAIYQSDVSDPAQVSRLHEQVMARHPTLDTLINNAGIMRNMRLGVARDLVDVTREIDVNLSGPIRMVQRFLPALSARGNALIINVSSGLAFVPLPISPVYSATKAAMHSYTKCLREQLRATGVTVVELAPPPVETALFRGEFADEMKGERAMQPEELARRALAAIEAGRTEVSPGVSNQLAAMSRVAPTLMFTQMAKLGRKSAGATVPISSG